MVARVNRNRPLPEAAQPRVNDGTTQRAFDILFVPLREVVRFLQPFVNAQKWQPAPFQTTWVNYPATSSFLLCGYKKDPLGRVHLRGLAQRSGGAQATVFVLPEGYRPQEIAVFVQYSSAGAVRVDVYPDGRVIYGGAAGAVDLSLDGVSFDTES